MTEPSQTRRVYNLSFVLLVLAFFALLVYTIISVGWITKDYKSVPAAWLGGGLTLYVASHLL